LYRLQNREAVRFNNGFRTWKLTYRQLYRRIGGLVGYLDQQGLKKGDRLLLWGENRPEWIVAFWGCLARGIEVVPIDFHSSYRLAQRIQKEVAASLLIHGATVEWSRLEILSLAFDRFEDLEETEDFEIASVASDDVVEILYTSGTTGEPKGVVHRHRNICSNLKMFRREIGKYNRLAMPFQPIRILDMLPLSHMFGQSLGIFFPLLLESSVVFLSELHPRTVMETIRRERVSVLVTVPRLLASLRQEIENRLDLPTRRGARHGLLGALGRWWRYRGVHSAFGWKFWALVVGGARLSSEEEEFWWLLGFVVVQGYGLTETSPIVATNHPLRPQRGSIGWVIEGQEVRIAPDGEILVRGESVVSEYHGAAGESSTMFRDGWLHTGDIGEMDEEGRLYYRGRKKDVIVTSDGLNVYPQDVEAALNRQPGIKDSVVIGLRHEDEEQVHAVLLLAETRQDVEELLRKVNAELEPHQRIRGWSIWTEEDFPRTPSTFKIKRRPVRSRVLAQKEGERGRQPEGEASGLVATLASMTGRETSHIRGAWRLSEDLGLSSLDRVDLLSRLENDFGAELDEEIFAQLSTVEELQRYIRRAGQPEAGALQPQLEPDTAPRITSSPKGRRRADAMPRWPRTFPFPWIRHAVLRLGVVPLFRHYIDFSVQGISNLDEVDPPLIFAANHESHLDTIAILSGLPFRWGRWVAPAMRKEHFRAYFEPGEAPWKERVLRATQYWLACGLVNAYPLPQEMAGVRESLKFTGELVQAGYCPLVYPEGERSPDGKMHPFKSGIGLMAMRLRVPVVPLHLRGMYQVYSVQHSWPETGAVRMRVGPPLSFPEGRNYEEATRQIETAVQELGRD
jgi:long-chain acyl-CoA synthetase